MRPSNPLLDVAVAKRVFAEAEQLYEARQSFETMRWEIVRPVFSTVEVFRRSRADVRLIGVRLELRNYNFAAPSVTYIAPDGTPVPWPQLEPVVAAFPHPSGLPRRWIVPGHSATKLPFLCQPRIWEYHTHVQHRHDRWDCYRETTSLQSVVTLAFEAINQQWLEQ